MLSVAACCCYPVVNGLGVGRCVVNGLGVGRCVPCGQWIRCGPLCGQWIRCGPLFEDLWSMVKACPRLPPQGRLSDFRPTAVSCVVNGLGVGRCLRTCGQWLRRAPDFRPRKDSQISAPWKTPGSLRSCKFIYIFIDTTTTA